METEMRHILVAILSISLFVAPAKSQPADFDCQSAGEYLDTQNLNALEGINNVLTRFWHVQLTTESDEPYIQSIILPWFAQCESYYVTAHNSLVMQRGDSFPQASTRRDDLLNYYQKMITNFATLQSSIKSTIALRNRAEAMARAKARERGASQTSILPACDSDEASRAYKRAIEESPSGKQGLRIELLRDAKEDSYDPDERMRNCSATAFTNAGKHFTIYTIEETGNGQFYLSAKIEP
jgi:hypothetical protein